MFCKHCGTILVPKKTEYGSWMACPQGHSQPSLNTEKTILVSQNQHPAQHIAVSDGQNPLAVHDHICKRCGYDKCELIEVQPFYSDEDPFYRMKCGKCGWTERLEGKLG